MVSFLPIVTLISALTTAKSESQLRPIATSIPTAFNIAPLLSPWGQHRVGGKFNRRPSHFYDAASTPSEPHLGKPICTYKTVTVQPSGMNAGDSPQQAVSVEDLTPELKSFLAQSGMRNGAIHVISRHTTTAITINERESRLAQDVEEFFLKICPPDERSSSEKRIEGVRYLHNDIDQRPDGEEEAQRCRENGWDIDDPVNLQKWRDQEPINAHSHLISMTLGSSECIPVVDGEMVIGQWQSVLLVDLDGPRTRTGEFDDTLCAMCYVM